jgi:hypothetical protein
MTCDQKIKELERRMNRRLTPAERKAVQEKLHHNEIHEHEHQEEEAIVC